MRQQQVDATQNAAERNAYVNQHTRPLVARIGFLHLLRPLMHHYLHNPALRRCSILAADPYGKEMLPLETVRLI